MQTLSGRSNKDLVSSTVNVPDPVISELRTGDSYNQESRRPFKSNFAAVNALSEREKMKASNADSRPRSTAQLPHSDSRVNEYEDWQQEHRMSVVDEKDNESPGKGPDPIAY